jgi:SAM-dependent methyltransferase
MDHARRTQQSYDAIAEQYQQRNRDRSVVQVWIERFADLLPANARVLDLGAGPCIDSPLLQALGLNVVALDRSARMLRLGRERFSGPCVRADLRQLPFAAASFAGAWASASLLHVRRAELLPALVSLRECLIPAGVLYLALKGGDGERWDETRYGPDAPRYFSYYRDDELNALLHTAGFEIVVAEARVYPRETWLVRIARASGPG